MAAREATDTVVAKMLYEGRVSFADSLVENVAQCGHRNLWVYFSSYSRDQGARGLGTGGESNSVTRRLQAGFHLTRDGLGNGRVLLKPAACVLLDGRDLRARQPCTNEGSERLTGIVTTHASDDHPEVGAVGILGNSATAVINGTQF